MGNKERQVIVNSFILCHFNYCPLFWLFCSTTSQKKLETLNLLQFISILLDCWHLKFTKLCTNLNPAFLKNYFLPKPTSYNLRRNDVLSIPKVKTSNYGIKSIRFLGPKIWNSLPNEIKSSRNANQFKTLVKTSFSKMNVHATFTVNKLHNGISKIALC